MSAARISTRYDSTLVVGFPATVLTTVRVFVSLLGRPIVAVGSLLAAAACLKEAGVEAEDRQADRQEGALRKSL